MEAVSFGRPGPFHNGIGRRTGRLKSRLKEHKVGLRRLKDLLNGWVRESAEADFVPL
jgi:hypothetical protein